MEYYKNKLKEKVDLIFKNKGLDNNLVLKDSLFIGIKPGKYEIVWDIKQQNILKLEPINGEVDIKSGVYHLNHWKTLYSYQYIEFSLKEERDKKIKEVFKTMKTILVTGGAGYIGTHTIVELLKDPNYDVILLDNFSNSNLLILNQLKKVTNKPIKVYDFDCRSNLDDIFSDNKIDGVIHFAAFKSVGESVENPLLYYDNNINSLINLLSYCKKYNVKNFVFSSSCSLYGNVKSLPVDEETPLSDPESPYAYTKLVGERILQDFSNSNKDFKIVSLRYFNPVGAHESGLIGELPINKPNNILPAICNSADTGEEMTIFGTDYDTHDGSCIRDYIHVSDIANAHYLALEYVFQTMENNYDVFNLGSDKGYSVIELISAFEEENEVKVNAVFGDRREGDVVKIYSNSFKARKLLNWKAEKTIDDIVTSAWNWHKNKNKI